MPQFRVLIPFREPTFELRIGRGPDAPPYLIAYTVCADSPEEARELGLVEFFDAAARSGVGWVREPVEDAVRVEELVRR